MKMAQIESIDVHKNNFKNGCWWANGPSYSENSEIIFMTNYRTTSTISL
jgi:hypothetical protein